MPSAFEVADRADRLARRRVIRRVKAIFAGLRALLCGPAASPKVATDRGYLDTDTFTAADIRRAWSHMREVCGLVATSACRDELIRQALRQARAREAGERVPPPDRPNRAALIAREADHGR